MNQHDNTGSTNQQPVIEDLTINGDQAAAIKAGTQLQNWVSHGHVLTGNPSQ